jgi:hypothetical protein
MSSSEPERRRSSVSDDAARSLSLAVMADSVVEELRFGPGIDRVPSGKEAAAAAVAQRSQTPSRTGDLISAAIYGVSSIVLTVRFMTQQQRPAHVQDCYCMMIIAVKLCATVLALSAWWWRNEWLSAAALMVYQIRIAAVNLLQWPFTGAQESVAHIDIYSSLHSNLLWKVARVAAHCCVDACTAPEM